MSHKISELENKINEFNETNKVSGIIFDSFELLKDIKKYKKILYIDNNIDTKSDVSDTEQCIQNNLHKPQSQ